MALSQRNEKRCLSKTGTGTGTRVGTGTGTGTGTWTGTGTGAGAGAGAGSREEAMSVSENCHSPTCFHDFLLESKHSSVLLSDWLTDCCSLTGGWQTGLMACLSHLILPCERERVREER